MTKFGSAYAIKRTTAGTDLKILEQFARDVLGLTKPNEQPRGPTWRVGQHVRCASMQATFGDGTNTIVLAAEGLVWRVEVVGTDDVKLREINGELVSITSIAWMDEFATVVKEPKRYNVEMLATGTISFDQIVEVHAVDEDEAIDLAQQAAIVRNAWTTHSPSIDESSTNTGDIAEIKD